MAVVVVPYEPSWPAQFEAVAQVLRAALDSIASATVEHVGSTSVPGLVAKPVLDIDVVVDRSDVAAAVARLSGIGYVHLGDLGIPGREALRAPDDRPRRNVYVCKDGSLSVRNHLAVRDVLRRRPDLRGEYAALKLELASDPAMDIDTYIARKSAVIQKVLEESSLTPAERAEIARLHDAG